MKKFNKIACMLIAMMGLALVACNTTSNGGDTPTPPGPIDPPTPAKDSAAVSYFLPNAYQLAEVCDIKVSYKAPNGELKVVENPITPWSLSVNVELPFTAQLKVEYIVKPEAVKEGYIYKAGVGYGISYRTSKNVTKSNKMESAVTVQSQDVERIAEEYTKSYILDIAAE